MKISSETISVLQNFAIINNGIQVKPGLLKTISTNKTLLASAIVKETFDVPFCIYDLSQFLATISLFDSPEYEFNENSVDIIEGDTHLTYVYADPATIITVPEKELECDPDVSFHIDEASLTKLLKAGNVLDLPNLVIQKCTAGEDIFSVEVTDIKNTTSNNFRVNVTGSTKLDSNFRAVLKVENLKLIPDQYDVTISSKGIARFEGPTAEYFVAVEAADSKF